MTQTPIRFNDSIAFQLLKTIFGFYLIVAIFVTTIQLSAEYYHAKESITQELKTIPKTFGPGIADALWTYNRSLLKSILIGMRELPIVTGVTVKDSNGKEVLSLGIIIDHKGESVVIEQNNNRSFNAVVDQQNLPLFSELFGYVFPVNYVDKHKNQHTIGEVTVYSSTSVAIERIQYGFILIVVNSVVKTLALWALFIFFLKRILGHPLQELTAAMKHVNLDNLDNQNFHLNIPKRNEFMILEETFNSMTNKLRLTMKERKSAEESLRESEERLQAILDNTTAVIYLKDVYGHYILINRQHEILFHITKERIIGKTDHEVFSKELADAFLRGDQEVLETIAPIQLEDHLPLDNGIHTYISVKFPLCDATGTPNAVCGISTDITERKKLEEMMIQTKKMMSLGELAAGTAHEINNPLSGILLSAQNIQNLLSPEREKSIQLAQTCGVDLQQMQTYLEKRGILSLIKGIQTSGEKAAKIVANMLQFSRQSEGEKSVVNFPDLLESTLELASSDYDLKKKYDFRNIHIIQDFQPEFLEISCIATEIEQVVFNLVKNAAQAMLEANIQEPQIVLLLRQEENGIRLEVQDNGPGMDEDTCKRVFEPFFTTKPIGQGTGLGLSVSYFIITNNHNGKINVESSPGQGTKFVIHLPSGKGTS